MSIKSIGTLAAFSLFALPSLAMAGSLAITTGNVNLRAGPAIGYPVVDVARSGDQVYVHGCLSERAWCDVDYRGHRGWMSSNYIAFYQSGSRYVGQQAAYRMRAPVITFSVGTYWDRHYRGRNFYGDRSRWENFYRGSRRSGPSSDYRAPTSSRSSDLENWRDRDSGGFTERRENQIEEVQPLGRRDGGRTEERRRRGDDRNGDRRWIEQRR